MTGYVVGYVGVSSIDQNTDWQLEAFQVAGIHLHRTYVDKAPGRDTNRPNLVDMIGYVRDGDMVVVHSMDRLARNLEGLRALVYALTGKGVQLRFLKESLIFIRDKKSPMADLLMNVMGSFAQFERELIRERQLEGSALAKERGVYKGRKRVLTAEQVIEIHRRVDQKAKKAELARRYNVSRATIHRYLRSFAGSNTLPTNQKEEEAA